MDKLDYSWKGIDYYQAKKIANELLLCCPYSQVDFSHNSRLNDQDSALLIKAIASHDTVAELKFTSSKLSQISAKSLTLILAKNKIKKLVLSNNNFDKTSMEILSQGLLNNISLEELDLSTNPCQESGLRALLEAIQTHSALKILLLNNFGINNSSKHTFLPLSTNRTLEKLSLYSNSLGHSAVFLLESLAENKSIKHLDLEKNNIVASCNKELAEVIKDNVSLNTINFANNPLGSKDFSYLAESLSFNNNLNTLDLSSCQLNDRGFLSLIQNIGNHQQLERLLLRNNGITSEGLRLVTQDCKNKLQFREINFSQNNINNIKSMQYLIDFLQLVPYLKSLDISKCYLDKNSLEMLIDYLLTGKSEINEINLSGNNFGDQEATLLQRLIQQNTCVQKIYLDENIFTTKGIAAIFSALKNNKIITKMSKNNTFVNRNNPLNQEILTILARNIEFEELKLLEEEINRS